MSATTRLRLRGFEKRDAETLLKTARKQKPISLGPLLGKYFVQSVDMESNTNFVPQFTFTAELIQLVEVTKAKKPRKKNR
jgi:hypothetical protein